MSFVVFQGVAPNNVVTNVAWNDAIRGLQFTRESGNINISNVISGGRTVVAGTSSGAIVAANTTISVRLLLLYLGNSIIHTEAITVLITASASIAANGRIFSISTAALAGNSAIQRGTWPAQVPIFSTFGNIRILTNLTYTFTASQVNITSSAAINANDYLFLSFYTAM